MHKTDIREFINQEAFIIAERHDLYYDDPIPLDKEFFIAESTNIANKYLENTITSYLFDDKVVLHGIVSISEVVSSKVNADFLIITDKTLSKGVVIDIVESGYDFCNAVETLVAFHKIPIENIFTCYGEDIETVEHIVDNVIENNMLEEMKKNIIEETSELIKNLSKDRLVKYTAHE